MNSTQCIVIYKNRFALAVCLLIGRLRVTECGCYVVIAASRQMWNAAQSFTQHLHRQMHHAELVTKRSSSLTFSFCV